MKVAFFGSRGKVGQALCPGLRSAGYEVVGIDLGDSFDPSGVGAMIDFTQPDTVEKNVTEVLGHGIACIVGTTGLSSAQLEQLDALAKEKGKPLFVAPNFALGAVLMMRFAAEAAKFMPRAEIVELHGEAKKDAPSGTALATAAAMGTDPEIHSVRLPGLVAHHEVLLGGEGQLLTIRHDTFAREAFLPGVLLALEKLGTLPPGLTVGLDALLH
ncbi:MAG: dihydrodipicolinate reductase C-terminal domain-containing protein [Gaiellaceae bacterium]|jgi:4-hydroxy-tetrahydrodipicolinate reductase